MGASLYITSPSNLYLQKMRFHGVCVCVCGGGGEEVKKKTLNNTYTSNVVMACFKFCNYQDSMQ